MEKALLINFNHQNEIIKRGFYGQGEALYHCMEYEKSLNWAEKVLSFLEIGKNPKKYLK